MDILSVLLAVFVALLWGITPNIHKVLLSDLSFKTVMVISSCFYFSCTLLFTLFYKDEILKDLPKLDAKHLFGLAIVAVIAGFLANIIYLMVLQKNKSYVISALIYAAPLFTLLGGIFVLKERITLVSFLGVMLIVIGILCIGIGDKISAFINFRD